MQPQAKEHQGLLSTVSQERRAADPPSEIAEGTNLADALISDFWLPEL